MKQVLIATTNKDKYDAVFIKGKLEPNIKDYLNKILYENYLDYGEEYAFNRAYCIVDKEKNNK